LIIGSNFSLQLKEKLKVEDAVLACREQGGFLLELNSRQRQIFLMYLKEITGNTHFYWSSTPKATPFFPNISERKT